MDGQMRLCLKVRCQGYNWPFLTIFDFTIIFHCAKYLPCLVWCHYFQHNLTCVTVQLFFSILTYCINVMDRKSQKNTISEYKKVRFLL